MSTPAELYRNAIDLNRYSNSVAKRIIVSYNDLLVDTAQRLAGLDAVSAPAKAARLRATLGQLKTSLNAWASNSTALSVRELEELAGVQAGFVERELREVIPPEFRDQVRSVEISPRFAEAVATADPTQQGIVSLSDDLEAAVKGAKDVVRVTVADGVTMTLPNGQVLKNSFANMAQKEAAFFGQAVRNGFLTGESTDSIIRRLKGRLVEGDAGPISQILRAGGESTVRANNQIRTLVRTSVNQVANAASMKAYEANQDITKKYRYTATLDSRTSPICRALDGTEHLYGKGPIPPQHFNCRSTTVPIVDYEGLGFDPPPPSKLGRPNGDKNIPDGENYGPWLKRQPKAVQEKVLGDQGQVGYFNALSRKYDPDVAIRRFVREDGSEKTIEDLKRAYGDPSNIKAKPKAKPKPKVAPKPKPQPAPKPQTTKQLQAQLDEAKKNTAKAKAAADTAKAKAKNLEQELKETLKPQASAPLAASEKRLATLQTELKNLTPELVKAKPSKDALIKYKKVSAELQELKAKVQANASIKASKEGRVKYQEVLKKQARINKLTKAPRRELEAWSGNDFRKMRAEQFKMAKEQGVGLNYYEDFQVSVYEKTPKGLRNKIAKMEGYLEGGPKYEGVVKRGMNMDNNKLEQLVKGIESGNETLAMESWTKNPKLKREFLTGNNNEVILSMKNKRGVDISGDVLAKFKDEGEVLQPAGAKYKIKSQRKEEISEYKTSQGVYRWFIEVEQL